MVEKRRREKWTESEDGELKSRNQIETIM